MGRKISDGLSVKVPVPAATQVTKGAFHYLGDFLGLATFSLTTDADGEVTIYRGSTVPAGIRPAEVTLNIEPAEYETNQIDETKKALMVAGADLYFDTDAGLLTTVPTSIYAGKVTEAADDNNVIWFKLAFRPFAIDDVTALGAAVGDPTDLETTAKTSIVAAVNEVKTLADTALLRVAEHQADSTEAASPTVAEFNALLVKLRAAGLMAGSE